LQRCQNLFLCHRRKLIHSSHKLIEIHTLPFQFSQQREKITDDDYFLSSDGFNKEFCQRQSARCKLLLKQRVFFIGQAKRHLI
jgi:hypothetical protein